MDNGVRDGRSNSLVAPPTLHRTVPPELHVLHTAMRAGLQITRLTALREPLSCDLRNARPTHWLCGHSVLIFSRCNCTLSFVMVHYFRKVNVIFGRQYYWCWKTYKFRYECRPVEEKLWTNEQGPRLMLYTACILYGITCWQQWLVLDITMVRICRSICCNGVCSG